MKTRFAHLFLVGPAALLLTAQVPAQTAVQPERKPAPNAPARAAVKAEKKVVAAAAPAATTATVTTVTAAGSVIVLADGIVANAAIASIEPPAPGFQYER